VHCEACRVLACRCDFHWTILIINLRGELASMHRTNKIDPRTVRIFRRWGRCTAPRFFFLNTLGAICKAREGHRARCATMEDLVDLEVLLVSHQHITCAVGCPSTRMETSEFRSRNIHDKAHLIEPKGFRRNGLLRRYGIRAVFPLREVTREYHGVSLHQYSSPGVLD
jgi:hypothetical protein